jgi:hypothetical protein
MPYRNPSFSAILSWTLKTLLVILFICCAIDLLSPLNANPPRPEAPAIREVTNGTNILGPKQDVVLFDMFGTAVVVQHDGVNKKIYP